MLLLIQGQGLYVYNQGQNQWEKITTAVVPTGWSEMFDYDSEHNVHAFCGLTSSSGGSVWAFRYTNQGAPVTPRTGHFALTRSALDCFPNPFRSSTRITYDVEQASNINMSVFDIQGRLLHRLVNGPMQQGTYSILWNGEKALSSPVTGSIYIIRLEKQRESIDRKVVFIK
jgi:hypothetical protein